MTSDRNERLLKRLLETFKLEARERITALATGLARIEASAGAERQALVEELFREAHSLKAAAHSVGQKEIGLLCQSIESVFSAVKRAEVELAHALVVEMQSAADAMDDFLGAIDGAPVAGQPARAADLVKALAHALEQAKAGQRSAASKPGPSAAPAPERRPEPPKPAEPPPAAAVSPPRTPATPVPAAAAPAAPVPEPARAEPAAMPAATATETVRLSSQRLEALLRQAEEMLSEKLASQQLVSIVDEAMETLADWQKEWRQVRGGVSRLKSRPDPGREAAPLWRFLDSNEAHMGALETALVGLSSRAEQEARRLASKVDQLLWEMKGILTVPFASQLPLFQRVVRDLAREQGKDVDFVFSGGDIELDRRILQELKDPMLHLVRNCVDHGIERPAEREAAGKPARAKVSMTVDIRDSDRAEFVIADDGAGISTRKLVAAATKLGIATTKGAEADDADLLRLVFRSGVSTSPMITDVSGRGLGLAIVLEKVERLGGRISVESVPGQGTTFRLTVPLSLATYHGISARVGDRLFVFPSLGVDQVVRMKRADLSTVENRAMVDVGGAAVPLVRLSDVLELPTVAGSASEHLEAVVVGAAGQQVAFEVDSVEDDREILVKPLGKCLVRVRNIQGGTILATGAVAPILNTHDLLKSAVKVASAAKADGQPSAAEPDEHASILVVEDSITARGLLRSILESAGYRVRTAVDGMEAWSALNLEPFDLVVSDVEMPRMNGFDLTARIRTDKKLADLPVVLVTALDSREDRERGVDVGANAYILKGGFEQGVLLEAVKRLV